ncbi:unnamed protein product [Amoebophrya sp. A120]|nr:unnamed protein product [Amoebophrya sp. A120]|eukprot:GSA120T00019772001.1
MASTSSRRPTRLLVGSLAAWFGARTIASSSKSSKPTTQSSADEVLLNSVGEVEEDLVSSTTSQRALEEGSSTSASASGVATSSKSSSSRNAKQKQLRRHVAADTHTSPTADDVKIPAPSQAASASASSKKEFLDHLGALSTSYLEKHASRSKKKQKAARLASSTSSARRISRRETPTTAPSRTAHAAHDSRSTHERARVFDAARNIKSNHQNSPSTPTSKINRLQDFLNSVGTTASRLIPTWISDKFEFKKDHRYKTMRDLYQHHKWDKEKPFRNKSNRRQQLLEQQITITRNVTGAEAGPLTVDQECDTEAAKDSDSADCKDSCLAFYANCWDPPLQPSDTAPYQFSSDDTEDKGDGSSRVICDDACQAAEEKFGKDCPSSFIGMTMDDSEEEEEGGEDDGKDFCDALDDLGNALMTWYLMMVTMIFLAICIPATCIVVCCCGGCAVFLGKMTGKGAAAGANAGEAQAAGGSTSGTCLSCSNASQHLDITAPCTIRSFKNKQKNVIMNL